MHGTHTKDDYIFDNNISEDPSVMKDELHFARSDISQLKESIKIAESATDNAELELSEARKTVKDLALRIEESNLRLTKIDKLDRLKTLEDDQGLCRRNTGDQYAEMMRDLDNIKQELSKIKLDMGFVLKEKVKAECETETANSMCLSYSSLVEELARKIDELNEEHVLVTLARIEALKECAAIEAQKKEEATKCSNALEKTRKKINDLNKEVSCAEELEEKLFVTTADVNRLTSELALIKQMDTQRQDNSKHLRDSFAKGEESDFTPFLHKISVDLEAANNELAAINEEGFQLMSSMDIIREELKQLAEEKARLKKIEKKAELNIQSVNSTLLRAKSKLEALAAAKEKANSMSSSLVGTLKNLRTEAETAKVKREHDEKETAKVKAEVLRTKSETDLAEETLEASIQELRAVKASETMALETLRTLVETSMKARASAFQHSSTITISTFEHKYLEGCAVEANKVADKKVAAAQAWTEALRTSEKEISIETMITQRKIKEIRIVEEEALNMGRRRDKNLEPEQVQFEDAPSTKSINRYGISTPARRPKFRKSGTLGGFHMARSSSITIDWRRKGVQNVSKFFTSNNTERAQ